MSGLEEELNLVDSHRGYLKRLSQDAFSDIYSRVSRGSSPEEIRDAALEVVPGYLLNLEEMASESASLMYTGIRESQKVSGGICLLYTSDAADE